MILREGNSGLENDGLLSLPGVGVSIARECPTSLSNFSSLVRCHWRSVPDCLEKVTPTLHLQ